MKFYQVPETEAFVNTLGHFAIKQTDPLDCEPHRVHLPKSIAVAIAKEILAAAKSGALVDFQEEAGNA